MISYEPLWETLKKRNISQYDLIKKYHVGTGLLDRLRKNQNITLNTIENLCVVLDCEIEEIVKIVREKKGALTDYK